MYRVKGIVHSKFTKGDKKEVSIDMGNERFLTCYFERHYLLDKYDVVEGKGDMRGEYFHFDGLPLVTIPQDRETVLKSLHHMLTFPTQPKGHNITWTLVENFYDTAVRECVSMSMSPTEYIDFVAGQVAILRREHYHSSFRSAAASIELFRYVCERWLSRRTMRAMYMMGFRKEEVNMAQTEGYTPSAIKDLFREGRLFKLYFLPMERLLSLAERNKITLTDDDKRYGAILREIYVRTKKSGDHAIPRRSKLGASLLERDFQVLRDKYDCVCSADLLWLGEANKIESDISEWFLTKIHDTLPSRRIVNRRDLPLSQEQVAAIMKSLTRRISTIAGGAGTGKTTIIEVLYHSFGAEHTIVLGFTGKCVSRVREHTGIDACTIDMLIARDPDAKFRHVIFDEASMISTDLFCRFIRQYEHEFTVTFVGDHNQLQPISSASILSVMMKLHTDGLVEDCVTVLKETHRYSGTLLTNARAILGEGDDLIVNDDFKVTSDKQVIFDVIMENRDRIQDVKVITAKREDVQTLNEIIREIIFGPDVARWMVNDLVMQEENDHQNGFMNGEEGIITEITATKIHVKTKSGTIAYPRDKIKFTHSYAITGHKSQGSEWNTVILYIPTNAPAMVDVHFLYTVITRAKQRVIVVSEEEELLACLERRCPERLDGTYDKIKNQLT